MGWINILSSCEFTVGDYTQSRNPRSSYYKGIVINIYARYFSYRGDLCDITEYIINKEELVIDKIDYFDSWIVEIKRPSGIIVKAEQNLVDILTHPKKLRELKMKYLNI